MTNEAFSRVRIDAQLKDQEWDVGNGNSVRFEYVLPDGTRADYVLCDRNGRSLAVIEAKRSSVNPADGARQARAYAEQLKVPFIFLANGEEVRFWDREIEAHPRVVKTFYGPEDLERRFATRVVRRDPRDVPIDHRIVERDYQTDCIEILTADFHRGRRKMLVEMATGTGKTRMAAAFIKRLFEANAITRVLFLVDRNTLAKQTEDAFAEHLPDYPCYRLRSGRRFQDEKRITITTLQSMINIYRDYSAGYFDLVISDECHRSIYGKWRGVLEHFDGVQMGLTATPCVANVEDGAPDEEDQAFVRDTLRFFEVERPTYSYKMKDAIREGYLVPYQIYKAQTVKTAAEGGFPVARTELDWTGMDSETRSEFERLFAAEGDPITVDPSALERRFTVPERNRAMVREYRDVLTNGYVDGKGMQRKPLLGKTIVFAVTKRHAETLARLFDTEFAHLKPSPEVRFADYVVSGLGQDDSPDGETIIKRFKKERYPEILVSVNMLDTGFDCPEVVNLVFARFTKSAILYQQMRGRGTRKSSGKSMFTLFDFVGVTAYHGDEDEVGEGGYVVQKPKPKPGPGRKLLVVDVDDHIDPLSRAWITTDDDGRLIFPEASVAKAADVGAKFEAWLLTQADLSVDQRRWLGLVGSQLRANADGWEEFTAGHFAFEPFSSQGGLGQAMRVFGGSQELGEILNSLNRTVYQGRERSQADSMGAKLQGDRTLPQ